MKRDNIKPILLIMGINLILSIIVIILLTNLAYKQYVSSVNNVIMEIIGQDELTSVQILNNEHPNYQQVDLSKYGINKDNVVINNMYTSYKRQLLINIIMVTSLNILFTILLCLNILRYNKKIINLTEYAHKLNNREYELLIEENNEGELSYLQSELYKMMVALKEESQKEKKQKMTLKNCISDISHQIKTPLTSINMLLELLSNSTIDSNSYYESLHELGHEIDKINFLVITLLKLARFDANVIKLKKEQIKVSDLFTNIKDNLAILIELKNINIITECSDNIVFIGDYKWEVEALTNILKNCLEHTPLNKNIYLKCIDNSLYTKIIIKDEGSGIDKEDINHIFERFYKSKNSDSDSIGIGLSLAQNIITQDNGYIKVQSELNKGTTFEIKYIK